MLHSKSIILKVVLISFVSSNYLNTSLRERIPIYLQEICPGSGVCLNDIIDPDNDLPSCCGACSCSEDCEVNGNCCFPNEDNDATARSSSRYHTECLYPIANKKYKATAYDVHQSYYMILSTAKDTLSYGSDNITDTSCGDVKVAPWGSMYPVYSKTTGKIYKNSVCADAHNITDGELWRANVFCEKIPDVAFSSRLQNGSIPDNCYVVLFYRELYLIKSEICYHGEHYEANCPLDTFEIPAHLSMSVEEIIASCESGLISPYNYANYANVFCFICQRTSTFQIMDQEQCFEDDNDFDGRRVGVTFTMIIDDSFFGGTFSGVVQSDTVRNVHLACPTLRKEQTGRGCRAMSCPLGQILSSEGGCFFPGNKWYTNGFTVVINLSSGRMINISTLYSSIQNLKSPWPSSWTIINVLYKATPVPLQTRDIVVIQYILFHLPFNPKSFFSKVHRYISKPWLLKTNNKAITLQGEISGLKQIKKQEYHSVYINRNGEQKMNSRTVLTKLYLCDNVILLPSEYSININPDYKTLFNSITNKTLFEWEYAIDDNGNGVVCLEDSGFYRVTSNNSIKISPHIIIVQYLAIFYMTKVV